MKKKFISLLLAFFMIVTVIPIPALAQNDGPVSEELEKLNYEFESVDGQDYIKISLPANSVEIVEDPYAIRPMSITDTVPNKDGAGQLINWGSGIIWQDYNNTFSPDGGAYVAELIKDDNGTDVVIATASIKTATVTSDDIEPDKDTTYQFTTTSAYKKGDEKLSGLVVSFPIKLEQNILYEVVHKAASGKLAGTNNDYHLVFLAVTRVTSPVYTAEWDTTSGALKPTLKGKLTTGTKAPAEFKIFDQNDKYGNIIDINTFPQGYIDENDKDGKLIGLKKFDANGSLSSDEVQWGKNQNPVMKGEFLSYSTKNINEDGDVTTIDHALNKRKGVIPAHFATMNDGVGKKYTPPYFYNLVGDNDHMWRFQLKEGLEVKFNTGVGSETEGGQTGQDIGQPSTIAYGEKFDSTLKGAFSDKNIILPTSDPLPPTLTGNTAEIKFLGWKLVEGQDKPVNPQKITTDASGNQTLTEVKPDYETTDKINLALNSGKTSFTKKNPTFFAVFGIEKKVGKASIEYLDDKGAEIDGKFKFSDQDYKTEKTGNYNTAVTATKDEAPKFIGYAIKEVKIEPENNAKYADPATATIKFVYNKLNDVIPSKDPTVPDRDNEKPDGYVTVRFLTNQNGTLEGETTYYVNPKANKTMADITAPTIKPNEGYKISETPAKQWQPNLDTNETIIEDLFYVANYESVSKVEIAYVSMDTDMGTVSPGKEEVKTGTNLTGSTATANAGYEFVKWVTPDGTEVSTDAKFTPSKKEAAIYIAKFKKTNVTLGKVKVIYVDENNKEIDAKYHIDGVEYPDEKFGPLNTLVKKTDFSGKAPEFEGYVFISVMFNPKGTQYRADGKHTVRYRYYKKVTTDDKSGKDIYFPVDFDANKGQFTGNESKVTAYVYCDKQGNTPEPVTFKEVREEVEEKYGKPIKKDETFIEWQDKKSNGTKVDEDYVITFKGSNNAETFYANYGKAGAYISYRDLDGKLIEDKFKFISAEADKDVDGEGNKLTEAQKYPTEKAGKAGEDIAKDVYTAQTAPTFIGYKFNRIELNPANAKYAMDNKATIKIYYEKLDDVIPSTGNDKPDGYVTVEFLAGNNGTLSGETKFYVNPKADPVKTMAEITQPTIKANQGFKVADPKWKDAEEKALDTTTQITKDLTYTAQYTGLEDIIKDPTPEDNTDKPEGYVTVTFKPGDHGKLNNDTKDVVYYVNPKADPVKTMNEITEPTVTANTGYEVADPKWKDAGDVALDKATQITKDLTYTAQYKFTKDVVPQGPGEDKPVVPDNYVKVTFKEGDHGIISASQTTIYWVNPDAKVKLTAPAVTANAEYKHTAWKYNVNNQDKTTSGNEATKFVEDTFAAETDITAQYKKKVVDTEEPKKPGTQDPDPDYVKVDFKAETHGNIKDGEKAEYWVLKDETIELKTPAVEANKNYAFKEWNPAVQPSYSEDKTHNAVFVYTGDDVVPQPGEEKPDVPENFVEVEFKQGTNGKFAADATTIFWVNPTKEVTVTAPTVTANDGWKHVAWTYGTKEETNLQSVTDTFTEKKTTITAKYLKKVLEEEPQTDKDAYVKVTFKAETNGKLADDKTEKSYWVLKDTPVSLTEPTVTANTGWKFIKFDPAVKTSYSEDTDHIAQYKKIIVTEDPKDKDYVKVTFDPGKQGTIKTGSNAEVWVLKDEKIDPKAITPELDIKEKYALEKWNPAVQKSYSKDTKHTAIYKYNGDDVVPQKPGDDKPNVPDDFVKVEFTKGAHGVISSDETTIYWVNPKATDITVTAPKVTADPDWKHTGWEPAVKTAYTESTTHVAQYKEKVVTTDPGDEDYVKLTFKAEANGKFADDKTESYVWVLKDTNVKVTAPEVTPNSGYTFTEWSPAVKNIYDQDTTHTAQYKEKDKVVTEDPHDKDYIKVIFNANGGHFESDTVLTKDVWVLNGIATFADAKAKVANPTREKAAFKEWQTAASDGTKVDDGKVLSTENETFYAAWTDSDKIIEDPTTPDPKPGYVRLTFDATADGKIGKNQEKYIDVLAGTKYKDPDLQKVVKKIVPTYKDNTKVFEKWNQEFPNTNEDVETSRYTAQYKDNDKIIDKDPTNPGDVDDKYIRFVFDANTKDNTTTGKIGENQKYIFDVLKGTRFSDSDLQEKINKIVPVADDTKLKFNVWDPSVLKDNTLVENATANDGMSADGKTITYNATYTDKDKIIDVTPGSEDQDPKDGYVRFIFKADGKDDKNADVTGKVKGNKIYAFDVLKGTAFNDNDLQKKVADLKAIPDANNYKFEKWNPEVKNDATLVEAGENGTEVTKHEYTATYEKLEKIIDVTDPTVEPDEYHVRLTFKSGEGTFGKDTEDKDITQKQIDVLKDIPYTDKDLLAKIKTFEEAAKANDATKKFNAWDPLIPATGLVAEETFTAQYVDKDKIIDKDPDNPGEVQDGYIRFVFDANTKDNKITGKIGEKQKAIFDVLKGTKFSDPDLQAKINGITPIADNKVFKAWDPSVLKNDTSVENATAENGMSSDGKTITYNATYKDKDADIVPGDQEKPEGYVTVRFLTNKNGTLTGQTTYYVNPKAGKKMSDITPLPTIKANDGYSVATPNWKPDFTNDTSEIKEDRNYVANYNSFGKAEITYISMDTKMGKVAPASEEIKDTENLKGSTATAESGYEFVNWVDVNGKQVSDQAKFKPNKKEAAVYIAVFKEKTTETTADKVQKLYDFEGVDLAAFVGDTLDSDFWKDGVKTTEKDGNTLTDDEKTAINTALENATVTDLSERNTDYEVLSPSKGTLKVTFEDGSTITVEQKLYVYDNGSEKPKDPNQPAPKDKVEVTYKAGEGVESFTDKVVMVKKGTLEKDLPGKPDAKATDGFKDPKWTANPAIDATNGIQVNTTLTASAVVDHDYAKTTFTVKKVWPAGITDVPTMNFTLYRKVENGQEEAVQGAEVKIITKDVTEATWDNIAKTDSEGKDYAYSVKETFAEKDAKNDNWILGTMETDGEGNNTITNKLKTVPGEGDKPHDDENFVGKLTITKKLENEPVIKTQSNGMRRAPKQALKFSFKVTGPYGYEETFELAANESKTLENLAYGDYIVEETDAKGYTPEYSKAKETLTKDSPNGSITVTNKNKESTDPQNPNTNIIDVTVKKVWANVPQGTNTPQVKIELWRKGYDLSNKEYEQKVGEFTTAAGNTSNEETNVFKDLAKQDPSGREFTYYAKEPNVPENYTKTENGLTVTNTYQTPPTPAKEYTVTYAKGADAATGTMNPVTVTENTDHTVLANGFTNEGFTFTGWKVGDTTTIVQPGATINVTADVTLTAQWKKTTTPPTPATEYTVTYAPGSEDATGTMNPVTVAENTDHTVLANGFTNEGFTFTGWKVGDTTTIVQPGATINVTADVTLTAQWEKTTTPPTPGAEYTVTYVAGSLTATGTMSADTGVSGTYTVKANGFTNEGYTFKGWKVGDTTQIVKPGATINVTGNVTLTAQWEKTTTPPTPPTPSDQFTIHYVARYDDMGWVSRDYEVVENPYGDIMGSTAIARNGYRFVKWVDEYGDTLSRFERFVPYERREATYFAIFERDYPYDPYYPDHRPDDRPNRPDDRRDRDDRDDHSDRKPGDTRPVLDHEAYMFGYTDGTVRPNGNITRAEAAALVTRLLGIEAYASAAKPNFPDTPSAWYNKAINAAVERGIMKGYPDGRFRPNAPITRAEFTQMISTIDNKPYGVAPFADVVGHWAERPIGSEYQAGRITGYPDGLFRPNAYITRCEAVVILNKIFERKYDELSPINAINAERIKRFIDLTTSFWGYNDMVEATNSHSFKRRVEGRIEEDWVLVK